MILLQQLFPRRHVRALLGEMLTETWVEDEPRVRALIAELERISAASTEELRAALALAEDDYAYRYEIVDGVAVLPIAGHIVRTGAAFWRWWGIDATGTVELKDALANALADTNVRAILLAVDSPGGSIRGLQAAASAIREARDAKPVFAHVEDTACSAAYWLASQAERISACVGGSIGSIGCFTVISDWSGWDAQKGIKTHVLSSGPLKAIGVGEVKPEHLAELQRRVDQVAADFCAAIAAGRGRDEAWARELASGRVWTSEEAVGLSLIDSIESAAAAIAALKARARAQEEDMTTNAEVLARLEAAEKAANTATEKAQAAEARAQAAEARAAAATRGSAEVLKTQRAGIVEAALQDGRFAPTERADLEAYAEFCGADVAKLQRHVAARQPKTHASALGGVGRRDEAALSDESVGTNRTYAALGVSAGDVAKYANISAMSVDGRPVTARAHVKEG